MINIPCSPDNKKNEETFLSVLVPEMMSKEDSRIGSLDSKYKFTPEEQRKAYQRMLNLSIVGSGSHEKA